jgi:hypothetical protein
MKEQMASTEHHPIPAEPLPQPYQSSAHKHETTISGDIGVSGKIIVNLGPEETLAKTTESDYQKSQDRKKLFWEKLGFLVLTIYASLTFWQSCSTQKIASLTQQQVNASLRPYVGLEKVDVVSDMTVPTIRYIAVAKNYGSIPADGLTVNARSDIEYGGTTHTFQSPSAMNPIRLNPGSIQSFPHDLVIDKNSAGADTAGAVMSLIISGEAHWTVYIKYSYQWQDHTETQCYHFVYQPKLSGLGFVGADCPSQ